MIKALPKPIRFRLYPESKSLYFVVNVWPDHKTMVRYLASIGKRGHSDTIALASGYYRTKVRPGRPDRLSPICGEINCNRLEINAEIVSHEIAHLAITWAKRIKLDPMTEPKDGCCSAENERFCYALGLMVGQFTDHAYRLKVWNMVTI